ncbi:MAG: hypothetical protein K1Y36_30185 [Blastocatellia bacterium]|nr:hypothetical protein [Blastocatellia bacterium]
MTEPRNKPATSPPRPDRPGKPRKPRGEPKQQATTTCPTRTGRNHGTPNGTQRKTGLLPKQARRKTSGQIKPTGQPVNNLTGISTLVS